MGLFDRFRKKQTRERLAAISKGGEKAQQPETSARPEVKQKQGKTVAEKKDEPKKLQKPQATANTPSTAHAVLLHPLITEKSTAQHSRGQYAFAVRIDANKHEIQQAIGELYGVTAQSVNIQRYDGTWVTFGRHLGRTKRWKKAIVTLKEGESITITEAA